MAPTTIARYEVLNRIGRGGMGALYLARDPKIDRLVAIKLLHADLEREDLRLRFDREARSAGALNHPNIVTIFDYGVHDDAPYIVMEYIRGETLAELIKRRAALPLPLRLGLLEQLCRGLDYAHATGIIHRDIKPANLMVDQHGVLKILDFGIARLAESALTQMSVSIGTPGYMSPEQIEGRPVDRPSDIFAVGAVAYELLTFRQAFTGDSQHTIIYNVLHSAPDPIRSLAPDVDERLSAIVDRALDKVPANRYQTAGEMQRALQALGTAQGPLPSTPVPSGRPSRAAASETPTALASPAPGTPDRNLLDSARRAMNAGNTGRAMDLIDRVLAAQPAHPQALELQRLIEERRVGELLDRARAGLAEHRLTEASELVARALKIQPKSEAALELRSQLDDRRLDVERRAAGRARAKAAIDRGRWYLNEQGWEAARRAAAEALALDPENEEAIVLRDAADAGLLALESTRPFTTPAAPAPPQPDSGRAAPPAPAPAAVPPSRRRVWIGLLATTGVIAAAVAGWLAFGGGRQPEPPPAPPADTTPPVVRVVAPAADVPLAGSVTIDVAASDDVGVAEVALRIDGALFAAPLTSPPYRWLWPSADAADGAHTIDVESKDAAGNIGRASLQVTTANAPAPPPVRAEPPAARPAPPPAASPPPDPAQVKAAALQQGDALLGRRDCAGALAVIDKALADRRLAGDNDLLLLRRDALALQNVPGACRDPRR